MASLRDIRLRIRSVKNTQKITGAMKLVAAAKLRRAQESAEAARPYATALRAMLGTVAGAVESDAHPLLTRRPVRKTELLMITANRGLCGPFNSNVLKASERFAIEHGGDLDVRLSIIGTKGRDYFKRRDFNIQQFFENVQIDKASYADAALVGDTLAERFLSGEVDEVKVVSTVFKSPLVQDVKVFPLLPVEPAEAEADDSTGTADFIFEASRAQVLGDLLPRYLKTSLYSMILESAASEQGARMTAMDSASTNAAEMIDRLTITYNRARQAAITTELMEIIGGAEALKG